MSVLSVLFFLGFALLVMLGLVAVGLVFAASFFALVAAGTDLVRMCVRVVQFFGRASERLGETGRQFVGCWIGVTLSGALVCVHLLAPTAVLSRQLFPWTDLLGVALCIAAASQIADRLFFKRGVRR